MKIFKINEEEYYIWRELDFKINNIKKGEFPRLKCFHNGIILIVICFQI